MDRRVKIVATLGPASGHSVERLIQLFEAGANVVRINAAHGDHDVATGLVTRVREAGAQIGRRVPILLDLQGLKIRTGPLEVQGQDVPIARGSRVRLYPKPVPSTPEQIGINFPNLLGVITPGSRVLISDGLSNSMSSP